MIATWTLGSVCLILLETVLMVNMATLQPNDVFIEVSEANGTGWEFVNFKRNVVFLFHFMNFFYNRTVKKYF